ncbi:MAG: ribonuclease E/G [Lachnospiraceae bacterium]|nr:ribonuclease E/G [Lachnospiraceae bacterium]
MTNTGKILILKLYDKLLSMLIRDNQILSIQAQKADNDAVSNAYAVGNIYIGKVQNISVNIGAAFVDLGGGYLTFLPMTEEKDAFVTNRRPDGTLKIGDEVLVQIVKEPMKTKLAGVTTHISLSGNYAVASLPKYSVYNIREVGRLSDAHNSDMRSDDVALSATAKKTENLQVSSKLSKKQQMRFRSIEALQQIADSCPLIVRTNAGELEDDEPLITEAKCLCEEVLRIAEIADKRTCHSCLHRSKPDYIGFVQNTYQTEYDEIITDIPEVYENLKDEITEHLQNNISIRFYEDARLPLYKLYSVETRVKELLDKKVWLKSGGYLVIEPTEALISIDVNTGKCEKGKDKEETFLRINMEAAEMIALQLRARNLSGMILVDFINMKKKEHETQLIEYMRSLLKKDTVKANVVDMTGLGLLELTRKKVNQSFAEQMRQG